MIDPITDLAIFEKRQQLDNVTVLRFSFTKPSGDVGGYILYSSIDGSVFSEVAVRIDSSHNPEDSSLSTTQEGSTVYFTYNVPVEYAGSLLYFKVVCISTKKELSADSNIVTTTCFPSTVTNSKLVYTGQEVQLAWEIDTEGVKNSAVNSYLVSRRVAKEIPTSEVYIVNSIAFCTKFVVGEYIYVVDNSMHSFWFGMVTEEGKFRLDSTTLIKEKSCSTEEYAPKLESLLFYTTSGADDISVLDATSSMFITDTTFNTNTYYFYEIQAVTFDGTHGLRCGLPVYTLAFDFSYPYLRAPHDTNDFKISQIEWRLIKKALVDGNYYDKDVFTIPYFYNYTYTLRGYLGIAKAKLDVFLGEDLYTTLVTNDYGEFIFTFVLPYGESYFKFQARSQDNTLFSRVSSTYKVRTVYLYTFLSVLGEQLNNIRNEVQLLHTDISLTKSRYSSFIDRFVPFTGMYKLKNESDTEFRNISQTVFRMFEYSSVRKSLTLLLDSITDNLPTLDHYEIHYNYDIYQSLKTGYSFAVSDPKQPRGRYVYGISASTLTGEETDPETILVDTRWWPVGATYYTILMWDHSKGAEQYVIYKGQTEKELYYLTTIRGTIFCDYGTLVPNTSIKPIFYNFTDLQKPQNLRNYIHTHLSKFETRLKKNNVIVIILYATPAQEISDDHLTRIVSLLRYAVPPEIIYTVLYASDSSSYILY